MEEENTSTNFISIELRVYMHCDACERLVRRTVKKVKGVETVEVDKDENKVTVTGDFDSEKLLKKIKKKTGKKAEILIPDENEEESQENDVFVPNDDLVPGHEAVLDHESQRPVEWDLHYFDDENAQACRVM